MTNSNSTHQHQSLFQLSWPIFIDVLLHFITVIINTYMVSKVSVELLAAMGVGNQIVDLCITIFNFIAVGCSVVIAQYRGAKQETMVLKTINVAIFFNLILGTLICLLVLFFSNIGLNLLNLAQNIKPFALNYLHILGIFLLFEATTIIFAAILRVYGKSKAAMNATIIANLITIIGNYLSLYVFDLGLEGVAISTVIGRFVCLIILFYLLSILGVKFNKENLKQGKLEVVRKILHIGLPAVGENLAWVLHMLIATAFINTIGTSSFAANTLYFQLSHFIMCFGIAVSIGNEIIVGHLVGAKEFDKAYKQSFDALKLGFIVTILASACFYVFRVQILEAITNDLEIIQILLPIFLLSMFLEPGRTLNIVMVNALRASGDAKFPLYTALFFMWCVALPIAYFCGIYLEFGLIGIWIGFLCDEWLRGLTNTLRWKSKKWVSKRISIDN